MLGALIALLSALAFAFNGVLVRRGVVHATASQGAFVTVLMGVPMFLIAALVAGQLLRIGDLSLAAFGFLTAAGVIHFVVGRYFNYQAIGAIGASRTGPLQALQIPYSVVVALIFLDEGVTLWMVIGIALIMLGPIVMVERRTPAPVAAAAMPAPVAPAADQPRPPLRQVEGYLYAALSAVAYGTSPILIRAALEGESGLSVLGGLISYSAAAAVLMASVVLPSQRAFIGSISPLTFRVFFGAGLAIFLAQMMRFIALSMASVAVVSTLQRASVVFTLLLTLGMNRHLEVVNPRLVLSILISVAGAVLVIVASN
ncbi:MAG: EamA family transporter [Dehalococcoidia bacterium]|nr:EamA family transporter [Dehalococcoidia bacterium]